MRSGGARYLRTTNKHDYVTAARKLEEANMGEVAVSEKGGTSFVKKAPCLVKNILEGKLSSLCSFEMYSERYHLPVPKGVSYVR